MMRWRGAMLDISRHYFDAAFIKKTMSSLALFDYNTLHLHLTDDQG
jgi:hexosaminidase